MVKVYAKAAFGTLAGALVLGGVLAYPLWELAVWIRLETGPPRTAVVVPDFPGPFDGWGYMWAFVTAGFFVLALPKEMARAHKWRNRPRPGGSTRSRSAREDIELHSVLVEWFGDRTALLAARVERIKRHELLSEETLPPCPRCGSPVKRYKTKPYGWVIVRFIPCQCRLIVSTRLRSPKPKEPEPASPPDAGASHLELIDVPGFPDDDAGGKE